MDRQKEWLQMELRDAEQSERDEESAPTTQDLCVGERIVHPRRGSGAFSPPRYPAPAHKATCAHVAPSYLQCPLAGTVVAHTVDGSTVVRFDSGQKLLYDSRAIAK